MAYKWCVVPQCTNTSINSPHKLFVSVPTNTKRRKLWLQLARRDPKSISSNSNVFMCEDHLDMEKDTINYMKYKMGFSQRILLTDEAVPTKFHCQEDRKRRLPNAGFTRKAFLKRQRINLVKECLQSQSATKTHVRSLQNNDHMKQEIIYPEELPKTQSKEAITDPFITVEKSVQKMLEVCIDSLESAINAIRGGAEELEVCSSLAEGGLTPSVGLVTNIISEVKNSTLNTFADGTPQNRVKVNVMIRCRTGSDFCYKNEEMDTMLSDIAVLKNFDVDRFVFGALTDQQQIDEINCARVIATAHPKPVTFHRAFDVCTDPIASMDKIIKLGFSRLLTSGQRASAYHFEAIELIKSLLSSYGDKIEIMAGAGVSVDNARVFIDIGCKILHSSCKIIRYLPKIENNLSMGTSDTEHIYVTDENIVRKLKDTIQS